MHNVRDYRALIAEIAPELDIHRIRTAHGQFNDVVMVDEAWVFRFPRAEAAAATLRREVSILHALAGRLTLPIPAPIYTSEDAARPHMGYRMLPGEPLSRAIVDGLPDDALDSLARQLARFLRELHSLPVSLLPADVAAQDTREYWAEMYTGFRTQLFPHMRADACEQVTRDFTAFLADPATSDRAPVIRHGDLGGSNILYDAAAGEITGVIDFASVAPGDPATDLAALSTLGERLLERLLAAWPVPFALQARARFYRSTFALQEAWYGLRDGDMESFESGLEGYR